VPDATSAAVFACPDLTPFCDSMSFWLEVTGRLVEPVTWLCTPGAAYVIGHCLGVDGGKTAAGERPV
jgi:hypothetical protein